MFLRLFICVFVSLCGLFNSKKMESIKQRRTIRKYADKDVPEELLNRLLEEAARTQTMGNLQWYSVVVTRDAEMKKKLAPAHFNQPMVTQAPVVLTICADYNRTSEWCKNRDAEPGYDNLLSFMNAATDALLFTQTFSVLAEEEGLGLCYLGTTVYMPQTIIDVLQLPRLVMPVATLTVGYPDENPAQSDRLPLASFVHQETYKKVHPIGPKSNYLWRLYALDRAMEAGIDDVGIGALFGLYDYKFEALSLLYHTIHLEKRFNVGPHTISFPRIQEALNTDTQHIAPFAPSNEEFAKLIAVLRLSVPYTGMILTARESVNFRNEAIKYGVSQIDAGSDVGVGAYSHEGAIDNSKKRQFELSDNRSLDTVIGELCDAGFIPSSCTACYRSGRTGEHFMAMAKPGYIKRFCTANALLTLSEYAENYASLSTKQKCRERIAQELKVFSSEDKMKTILQQKLDKVRQGETDLYF